MAKICHNCGLDNRHSANFCRRCGRSLNVAPPDSKPASQRRKSSKSKWFILAAGAIGLCLVVAMASVFFIFRGSPPNEILDNGQGTIEANSSAGTVEPTEPTSTGVVVGADQEAPTDIPATAIKKPPTEAAAPPTAAPALEPELIPTLEALIIPGTEIEVPRVTDEEEIEIGREVAREIEETYGIYHDAVLEEKVNQIGGSILPFADRNHLPYKFTLINTPEINAFAAPGGFIFISKGMLDFTETDGELASVIAHEIAHIAQRHSAEEIETLAMAEVGLATLLDVEPELADLYEMEDGKFAADMAAMLVQQGWSRANELEADKFGVIYMAKAGYEPREALTLMERMLHVFPEENQESDIFDHLSRTHPPFEDRILWIEEVIADKDL